MSTYDYDVAVIGSGFGGSVAALRLTERGKSVCVLERGRRLAPTDLPRTNWNLPRYLWMPKLGFRGPQELTPFRSLLALTGSGVGGGSLVYGGVLDEPPASFFELGPSAGLARWSAELGPHFETARRMLGAAVAPTADIYDEALEDAATAVEGRAHRPELGVCFSANPGEELPDPYFGGSGPSRRSCTLCGACLTGCRVGAKNTLDQNYLYLAEQGGATVLADREVTCIEPVGSADGSEGYRVSTRRPGLFRGAREAITAKVVVVAAGTIGTNRLLLHCRDVARTLPHLSARLGHGVTNNREELLFLGGGAPGASDAVGIQTVARLGDATILGGRLGPGGGLMVMLAAPTALGAGQPGVARMLAGIVRHPLRALRLAWPGGWARRTRLLVAMESGAGPEGTFFVQGKSLRLSGDFAAHLPASHEYASAAAQRVGSVAQPFLSNALLRIPATAHIFGGVGFGADADSGVIDTGHKVFGYEGLYVVDGSNIAANPGVAPTLLITAMAERAASIWN